MNNHPNPPPCQLYIITPAKIHIPDFCESLKKALDGGPVAALQIRLKDAHSKDSGDDEICKAAEAIIPIGKRYGVNVIINDRPDLAKKCGADGVHIGQQDSRYDQARNILGPNAVIGVTCHNSRHLAMTAAEQGADYVAFGAFFPSPSKDAISRAEPELLSWWDQIMVVPCVAIGGINLENCAELVSSGADYLAVISAIWNHPQGPGEAVRKFNEIIANN